MPNTYVNFLTGNLSSLPEERKAGQIYFTIDDTNKGYIFFDKDSNERVLMGSTELYVGEHAPAEKYPLWLDPVGTIDESVEVLWSNILGKPANLVVGVTYDSVVAALSFSFADGTSLTVPISNSGGSESTAADMCWIDF